MTATSSVSTDGEGLGDLRGQPLGVPDLHVLVLDADGPGGLAVRALLGAGGAGRGRRFVRCARAVVAEAAGGVGHHVEAMAREPVRVPVPLVGVVADVVGRLPLVLVVAESVQHHDERVRAGARRRSGHVDVEDAAVEARDLSGTDGGAAERGAGQAQWSRSGCGGAGDPASHHDRQCSGKRGDQARDGEAAHTLLPRKQAAPYFPLTPLPKRRARAICDGAFVLDLRRGVALSHLLPTLTSRCFPDISPQLGQGWRLPRTKPRGAASCDARPE